MPNPQDNIPTQAYMLGNRNQLGEPTAAYSTGFGAFLGCTTLLAFFFIIFLGIAGAFKSPTGWLAIGIVLACLGFTVLVAFFQRKWAVYLYTDGFAFIRGRKITIARWNEVTNIRRVMVHTPGTRGSSPKTDIYFIHLSNGKELGLGREFSDRKEIIAALEAKTQLTCQ